jgi:hypothetical protein
MPQTRPLPFIVATVLLLLVHVPPPAPSDNDVHELTHTCRLPPILVGAVFTVTTTVAEQPPVVV